MFQSRLLFPVVVLAGFYLSADAVAGSEDRTITGAGAHFSWIVFKEQQKALEDHIHRPLKLFGKEQMLGAGCNACACFNMLLKFFTFFPPDPSSQTLG